MTQPTISPRPGVLRNPQALLSAALIAALPFAGCAHRSAVAPGSPSPRVHHVLDLADARAPLVELEPFLRDEDPAVRTRAVLAVAGRGGEGAAPLLALAARDPDATVRRAAALGLGLTDDLALAGEALALWRRATGPERPEAAFAVVRLAEDRVWQEPDFAAVFTDEHPEARRAAFRAAVMMARAWQEKPPTPPAWLRTAVGAGETDPVVRAAALHVLRRLPAEAWSDDLVDAVTDALGAEHPDVRAGAALALPKEHARSGALLAAALAVEPLGRVRAHLALALGRSAAPGAGPLLLDRLAGDPDLGVRGSAAGALAGLSPALDGPVPAALAAAAAHDPSRFVRVEALAALQSLGGPEAACALAGAAGDADDWIRAAACGEALDDATLALLARDPAGRVRQAALAEAGARGRRGLALCLDAADDPDSVVAALAVAGLGAMGAREALPLVEAALERAAAPAAWPDTAPDLRATALEALFALAPERARERAPAYLADPDANVRLAAAVILAPEAPEGEASAPPTVPPGPRLRDFPERRDLVVEDAAAHRVRVVTDRGTFVVRTRPAAAPVTVARFVARVRAGGYDGTVWHRIVPNFVVQGGDPLGNGWGHGGAPLRQEFNAEPFSRGTLGVPRSAPPDSGGCQLFFCHGETPHLDQRYTVFGVIESGVDVIDRLDLGDRILRAVVE